MYRFILPLYLSTFSLKKDSVYLPEGMKKIKMHISSTFQIFRYDLLNVADVIILECIHINITMIL